MRILEIPSTNLNDVSRSKEIFKVIDSPTDLEMNVSWFVFNAVPDDGLALNQDISSLGHLQIDVPYKNILHFEEIYYGFI